MRSLRCTRDTRTYILKPASGLTVWRDGEFWGSEKQHGQVRSCSEVAGPAAAYRSSSSRSRFVCLAWLALKNYPERQADSESRREREREVPNSIANPKLSRPLRMLLLLHETLVFFFLCFSQWLKPSSYERYFSSHFVSVRLFSERRSWNGSLCSLYYEGMYSYIVLHTNLWQGSPPASWKASWHDLTWGKSSRSSSILVA